ncbi:MAG TPA: galactitol-1-phosphate 5-dehydrogenase [Anaerohalosphaeraceae bacterium]|jgi:L-iditol 2-dehydrogenase|nr:galactitol-1-phosphate 5-dehydrogenase [Anaerohalosphaeraceae bacterium]HRT49605.1 galactitol-1-phosphate 5-dehydrogenase [Anaerohalosphaeraceae bacterium]HRT85460.1 galactitol-1-phosphate 5-dehydrogenase [Anaerohalosphaeraceae bacterium]
MANSMKALVLTAYHRLEYLDVPRPELADDEVLVKVRACGICGSDVHGMDGSTGRRRPPVIMGHEAAGVIVATGSDVHDWAAGDRVTFDSTVYCGQCRFCRAGRINLCDARRVLGVSCEEYRRDGAFAEYVAVPQRILYCLPDEVSFSQAAMVEPVSIALHAVNRTPIRLGDTAVVVGAGMIGVLVVQLLRAAGCGRIIAVDVDRGRLETARRSGASHVLIAGECDAAAEVHRLTDGYGCDVAFEAVGVADSLATAVGSVRKGGTVTLIGNVTASVPLPLQTIVTREITLYGSCASCGEYPVCLDLIARGAVDLKPLTSAEAPLSEGAVWFGRLREHREPLMKVILMPHAKSAADKEMNG